MLLRRQVARVVLLDAADNVLLIRSSDPMAPTKGSWWEIAGGGIDPGETSADAALRELWEETGLRAESISGPVWRQHAVFRFAGIDFDQHEVVHIARGAGGDYAPRGLEGIEAVAMHEGRWWSLSDVAARAPGRIIPEWLPEQLPAVLRAGMPAEPIDLGDVGAAEL